MENDIKEENLASDEFIRCFALADIQRSVDCR
jgi:hypothetical protein